MADSSREPAASVPDAFRVWIAVRGYELDANGHVNRTVYLHYGEHARWEYGRAGGIDPADLAAAGIGPVTLEETVRYHRELRAGDELAVSCAVVWDEGKTFRVEQEFRRRDARCRAEQRPPGRVLALSRRGRCMTGERTSSRNRSGGSAVRHRILRRV